MAEIGGLIPNQQIPNGLDIGNKFEVNLDGQDFEAQVKIVDGKVMGEIIRVLPPGDQHRINAVMQGAAKEFEQDANMSDEEYIDACLKTIREADSLKQVGDALDDLEVFVEKERIEFEENFEKTGIYETARSKVTEIFTNEISKANTNDDLTKIAEELEAYQTKAKENRKLTSKQVAELKKAIQEQNLQIMVTNSDLEIRFFENHEALIMRANTPQELLAAISAYDHEAAQVEGRRDTAEYKELKIRIQQKILEVFDIAINKATTRDELATIKKTLDSFVEDLFIISNSNKVGLNKNIEDKIQKLTQETGLPVGGNKNTYDSLLQQVNQAKNLVDLDEIITTLATLDQAQLNENDNERLREEIGSKLYTILLEVYTNSQSSLDDLNKLKDNLGKYSHIIPENKADELTGLIIASLEQLAQKLQPPPKNLPTTKQELSTSVIATDINNSRSPEDIQKVLTKVEQALIANELPDPGSGYRGKLTIEEYYRTVIRNKVKELVSSWVSNSTSLTDLLRLREELTALDKKRVLDRNDSDYILAQKAYDLVLVQLEATEELVKVSDIAVVKDALTKLSTDLNSVRSILKSDNFHDLKSRLDAIKAQIKQNEVLEIIRGELNKPKTDYQNIASIVDTNKSILAEQYPVILREFEQKLENIGLVAANEIRAAYLKDPLQKSLSELITDKISDLATSGADTRLRGQIERNLQDLMVREADERFKFVKKQVVEAYQAKEFNRARQAANDLYRDGKIDQTQLNELRKEIKDAVDAEVEEKVQEFKAQRVIDPNLKADAFIKQAPQDIQSALYRELQAEVETDKTETDKQTEKKKQETFAKLQQDIVTRFANGDAGTLQGDLGDGFNRSLNNMLALRQANAEAGNPLNLEELQKQIRERIALDIEVGLGAQNGKDHYKTKEKTLARLKFLRDAGYISESDKEELAKTVEKLHRELVDAYKKLAPGKTDRNSLATSLSITANKAAMDEAFLVTEAELAKEAKSEDNENYKRLRKEIFDKVVKDRGLPDDQTELGDEAKFNAFLAQQSDLNWLERAELMPKLKNYWQELTSTAQLVSDQTEGNEIKKVKNMEDLIDKMPGLDANRKKELKKRLHRISESLQYEKNKVIGTQIKEWAKFLAKMARAGGSVALIGGLLLSPAGLLVAGTGALTAGIIAAFIEGARVDGRHANVIREALAKRDIKMGEANTLTSGLIEQYAQSLAKNLSKDEATQLVKELLPNRTDQIEAIINNMQLKAATAKF